MVVEYGLRTMLMAEKVLLFTLAYPGTTIVKLMEDRQEWEGTATNLLNDLEPLKINTSYKLWPKSANSLSRRITEVKTNLREIGIIIKYDKDTKTRTLPILCQQNLKLLSPVSFRKLLISIMIFE